jgi:hypothetical protein
MDASNGDRHIAIYGRVQLQRGYCTTCQRIALITDNVFQCCGSQANQPSKIIQYKRMSISPQFRRSPCKKRRDEILERQENRCLYCDRLFGSFVFRYDRLIRLRLHWDHLVPWAYDQNNEHVNFGAACHICNGIKSNLMFRSVEDAKIYIAEKWKSKGYSESAVANDNLCQLRQGIQAEETKTEVLQTEVPASGLVQEQLRTSDASERITTSESKLRTVSQKVKRICPCPCGREFFPRARTQIYYSRNCMKLVAAGRLREKHEGEKKQDRRRLYSRCNKSVDGYHIWAKGEIDDLRPCINCGATKRDVRES